MNYWWACWLKYAWNWRTQKKPGRLRHISIRNATNSMNKLLSFVSRRLQRLIQKAVVSEIKAARLFASGRNDMLIRKHGTEHARNPSGTMCHWYQHSASQHPEQVSRKRPALFKFYSRRSVFLPFTQPTQISRLANICQPESQGPPGARLGSRLQVEKLREPPRAINQREKITCQCRRELDDSQAIRGDREIKNLLRGLSMSDVGVELAI